MKRIIVTAAGRKSYLEILKNYLIKYKNEFDEWVLWKNTPVESDLRYIEEIKNELNFVRTEKLTVNFEGSNSVYSFYKNCIDKNSMYMKIDDDIVYINPNSINDLFEYKEKNKDHFLAFGNTINNSICTHLHQRYKLLPKNKITGYSIIDNVGWRDAKFAEEIHRVFINKIKNNCQKDFFINDWDLIFYERCSINVVCWSGEEFSEFGGVVEKDDEDYLSSTKPRNLKKSNIIMGNSLFSHFAFRPQREHLEKTEMLQKYKEISENLC